MRRRYSSALEDISFDEFLPPGQQITFGEQEPAEEDEGFGDGEEPVSITLRRETRGEDSVQLYLRAIGRIKLLSAQEEIELARRIGRGD